MKRLFLVFTVFLFLSACAANETAAPVPLLATAASQPTQVSLPPVASPQLTQFYFVDEKNGWGMTQEKIVRTSDGGLTWGDATPPNLAQIGYAPFVFFDAQIAWVVIPATDGLTGTLYRTTNGGSTWTSGAVPFAFASLQFLDPQNGFALASLGAGAGSEAVALFKTTDSGLNWTRAFIDDPNSPNANDSLPLSGQKQGFAFLDTQRGWVGGSVPKDNYIYLYHTDNGGQTWNEANLALPAGYESAQTGNAGPQFFSATDGILVVNLSLPSDPGLATVVYRTIDGGQTWTPGQVIPNGRPADFYTVRDGVAWGGGQFYVTSDAGQTWGALTPSQDFSASLGSFQFVSPLSGWALTTNEASDPSLYQTTDGGVNWTMIIP